MSSTDLCARCGGDCGTSQCEDEATAVDQAAAELAFEGDWEPCQHEHDEECEDEQGFSHCYHQHCFACGGCDCAGYCDDYQTYNLRPEETGGDPKRVAGQPRKESSQ